MKVPGFDSPTCDCGNGPQTAKHVILYYPQHERRKLLEELGSQDSKVITSSARDLKAVSKWIIGRGLLDKFKLSRLAV
jgi:hypothetical protein